MERTIVERITKAHPSRFEFAEINSDGDADADVVMCDEKDAQFWSVSDFVTEIIDGEEYTGRWWVKDYRTEEEAKEAVKTGAFRREEPEGFLEF